MPDTVPPPYAIEIEPALRPEGQFVWAIRKRGKLIERSDRPYFSEAEAHEMAMVAIELDMKPALGGRTR